MTSVRLTPWQDVVHLTYFFEKEMAMLTHLPLNKMAAILADDISKCIFLNEKLWFLIKISLRFVTKGPIDNNPSLV